MKLEGTFPQDGIDGKLELLDANGMAHAEVYDKKGNPLKIVKWSWNPMFIVPDARPYVLYVQTLDKHDAMIHRGVLTLSGRSGRVQLHDRMRPVECMLDSKGPPKKVGEKKKTPSELPTQGKKG